jgi:hypothetical protein
MLSVHSISPFIFAWIHRIETARRVLAIEGVTYRAATPLNRIGMLAV